jgi:hypothetical protein
VSFGGKSIRQEERMNAIFRAMKCHPYKVQLMIATTNGCVADIMIQKFGERKQTIDWRRNAAFTLFGFCWFGNMSYLIYVNIFNRVFPGLAQFGRLSLAQKLKSGAGMRQLLGSIVLDVGICCPIIFYPTFYTFQEAVNGGDVSFHSVKDVVCNRYLGKNFFEDNRNNIAYWIPADALIFGVPLWLRMPVNHIAAFGYNAVLSAVRGEEMTSSATTASEVFASGIGANEGLAYQGEGDDR